MSRRPAQKGAGRAGARPIAGRLFQQNPPEVRFRWLAAGLPPDRRRGQRQPQLRDPARHWPGHHPEGGARRQRLRRQGEQRGGAPARHLPRHPVPRECRRQTGVLPQDTLQRTRPRRTGRRQDQALQTHRLALREDGTELRRLYLARLHLYLGEIRPHDLTVKGGSNYSLRLNHNTVDQRQLWVRQDDKGRGGFFLRNPFLDLCLRAGSSQGGNVTMAKKSMDDPEFIWVKERGDDWGCLHKISDSEQKLNVGGNGPYNENTPIIQYEYDKGSDHELWKLVQYDPEFG